MRMRRLIALDIDGTLRGSWGEIRHSSREAIRRARESGIPTVLATGRRVASTLTVAQELGVDLPLICYCGARVVEPLTGRELSHRPLPQAAAWDLLAFGREQDLAVAAFADDFIYLETLPEDYDARLPAGGFRGLGRTLVGPGVLETVRGRPITQVAAYGPRAVAALLEHREATLAGCRVFHLDRGTGGVRLQVLAAGVDKAVALAELCAELGVPPAGVLAVGDTVVDAGMLRWAGTGVAMPDADGEARTAADHVAAPDDPDPVATAILRWLRSG